MLSRLLLFLHTFYVIRFDAAKWRLINAGLATIYRGRLIPVMRGGDGRDGIFPDVPESFDDLTDEQLAELSASVAKFGRALHTEPDDEIIAAVTDGCESQDEADGKVLEALEWAADKQTQIKATQSARADAAQTFASRAADLSSQFAAEPEPDDGDDNGGEEGDETSAAVEEPEAAVAAAAPAVRRPLPAPRRHRPVANGKPQGASMIASTRVHPFAEPGERLTKRRLAEVLSDLVNRHHVSPGESVLVASVEYDIPQERYLDKNGPRNWEKIDRIASPQAITASGGLCAPLENVYTLPDYESAARPVRDALVGFRADRGGVNVPANPTMGVYDEAGGAVGIVTSAQDEQGGTYATKNCMRIECPTFAETAVDSIYQCIEAGNLTARAYPELMSRIDTLVAAEHARLAETALLDAIKAGSTAVATTNTASAGAMWEFFFQIATAAAGLRSRNRLDAGTVFRALIPEWTIDLLLIDYIRTQFDREKTRADITRYLQNAGVNPTFYKDSPSTGTSQIIGAQGATTLVNLPADVQWAIYPEGSWLHLDAGSLNLGIVRDSVLNATNDFNIFAETWEQAAFIGVESLWVTSALCPNGTVSAPKDLSAICFAT